MPYSYGQVDFLSFHKIGLIQAYVQFCDPRGRVKLDPRDIIWANLVEDYKMSLSSKFGSPRPNGYGQKEL
jgi:hypothetical protein